MKTYEVTIDEIGHEEWRMNGELHREDGPAVTYPPSSPLCPGGGKWYRHGKLHREDGPAWELTNGCKFWYINDKLHREDGPAMEFIDGGKYWRINGERLTEEEFNQRTKPLFGTTVAVDGIEYKLH